MLESHIDMARNRCYPLLFLVVFLFSCSSCPKWHVTDIKADCPDTTYTKFHWKPQCAFNGLEASLVCDDTQYHFYLNACTLLLPADPNHPGYTTVNITIDDNNYSFSSILFEGSQLTELPTEATDLVLSALYNNSPVHITIGRFEETLTKN